MSARSAIDTLRDANKVLEEAVVERTRALMNAKQAWEATFDAIVDPLAIVGPDMRLIRTNVAYAAQAGHDVRDTAGRHCHEVLFGRSSVCQGCPARLTFATGTPHQGEVNDPTRARMYKMASFPKPIEGVDTIDEVVCHYRDVTEERALQQRLRQSEKMAAVGTLSGGVAHEINNPLGAILAFAQLALRETVVGSTLHDFVTEIENSAQRCRHIVASLLDFSRPSRGERKPVQIEAVIDQALFLCRTQYGKGRFRVSKHIADDVPELIADRNQLGQVMLNLASNAFQAMDPAKGGHLEVSVTLEDEDHVLLVMQDDGEGIEPRYMAKVFEPFFTTKPEGKGTGLGLSISYSIVKDHGGSIEVKSVLGEGTRFEVRLPIRGQPNDSGG